MSNLNFFIDSRLNPEGFQQAMTALGQAGIKTEELRGSMNRLRAEGADVLSTAFSQESINHAYGSAAAAKEVANALNQAAAAALKAENTKLSKELSEMADKASRAGDEMRKLVNNERSLIQGSQKLQVSTKGIGQNLDELNKRYKDLSAAAAAYASQPGMRQQLKDTKKQMGLVKGEMSAYTEQMIAQMKVEDIKEEQGAINHRKESKRIQKEIELLEKKILTLRREGIQLQDMGDESGAAIRFGKAEELENTVRNFRKTKQSVDDAHKGFLNLTGFMNNDFLKMLNRIGFSLFITRSSISVITKIIGGMYKAMKQAATVMDKFQGASTVFAMHGFDGDAVRGKFMKAAQGAVSMEQAMDGAMQFMKAGQPELAASADELLKIARASAKLSGDLSKTSVIYDKLIRGVVRGSPKLIDDTGIVLKLGEANEKYAAEIGKTVEQLTAADKIQATYQATIAGGKVILEMARATESAAEKFQKLEGALNNRKIIVMVNAMSNLVNALDGANNGIDEFVDGVDHGTQIMSELANVGLNFSEPVQKAAADTTIALLGLSEAANQVQLNQAMMEGGLIHTANLLRMERGETVMLTKDTRSFQLAIYELEAAKRKDYETEQLRLGNYDEVSKAAMLNQMRLNQEKEAYDAVTEAVQRNIDKIKERLGIAENVDLRGEGAEENFQAILDGIKEAWTKSDRDDEILQLETDLQQKLVEIDDEYTQDRIDIQEKYKDDVAKLAEDTRKAIEEQREDFTKSLTRMQEDLDKKLDDIRNKSLEKSEDTEKKHKDKMLKLEDDHQRKLNDIQRKYEMARLKAVIDRDARALFMAEAQRAEALAKAKEEAEAKKDAELEAIRKKREEVEAEERKQTDAAIDEFQTRKQRMEEDYNDQINQMRENFQKQKAEKNAQRKEDLDALREAYLVQKAEEQKRHDDRLESMRKAWERERIESQRANFVREQERLISLLREQEMTEEWMQQYIQSWRDFGDALQGVVITPPINRGDPRSVIGGNQGGPDDFIHNTGAGGPTVTSSATSSSSGSPSPATVIPGTSCSGMGGRGYTGYDGQTYICMGGVWTLASSLNNTGAGGPSVSGATSSGGGTISGGNVTLNVQGDDLVKGIIKDTTYEVIVDLYE